MKQEKPSRGKSNTAFAAIILIGAVLFADWKDWIPVPNILSAEFRHFAEYDINGRAPWCLLDTPGSKIAQCGYLSQEQCQLDNAVIITADHPGDRALCVPNPTAK